MNIQLARTRPLEHADPKELTRCILSRFGLLPRKQGAKIRVEALLLELYERKKHAYRHKRPDNAVMTVEAMATYARVSRQTMYDYLYRFLQINILKKTSFMKDHALITGYELSGHNLETSFSKAISIIHEELDASLELVRSLQNEIKKEKLRLTTEHEKKEKNASPRS